MDRQGIYADVLKQGVRTYKYRNSAIKPIGYTNQNGNGAIFAFRSKERMNASRGIVVTSEEGILENKSALSHWTPNVYRYGTYVDSYRTIVKGHSEENLSQINTFTVDIDTKDKHEGGIILACLDRSSPQFGRGKTSLYLVICFGLIGRDKGGRARRR